MDGTNLSAAELAGRSKSLNWDRTGEGLAESRLSDRGGDGGRRPDGRSLGTVSAAKKLLIAAGIKRVRVRMTKVG